MSTPIRHVAGDRFGRLVLVEDTFGGRRSKVRCRCDCGNDAVVLVRALRSGITRSCGCIRREMYQNNRTLGGLSKTPEGKTWAHMIERCESPAAINYSKYGARGVRVCVGWHDFFAFIADMGKRPSGEHSIDRIDNARGYDCGHCDDCRDRGAGPNCRWATRAEQNRNRRNNVWIEAFGERMILNDWAKRFGCDPGTVRSRMRRGMSAEEALAANRKVA